MCPIIQSEENLARMKENYLILEVWCRGLSTAAGSGDRLYGLCKLPLHPFYIAYRDPIITESLLQAEVLLSFGRVYINFSLSTISDE